MGLIVDPYANAKSVRDPHGTLFIDGKQVADTLQCCHCNAHFISIKGSGIKRGFCSRCMQVTCGAQRCDPCVPFERRLDELESGKRIDLMGDG